MNKLDKITNTFAGRAASVGGAALAACGITELLHPQTSSKVVGVSGHLVLSFFIVATICVAPAFVVLARTAGGTAARRAGFAAAGGTVVLGLVSLSSLIHGSDLAVFNVLAPITNLAWLVGAIVVAVRLRRARAVPRALAVGLPLAWIATIPLATHGGGVLAGAYYLALGYLLAESATVAEPAAA
jgi:hypothetical protein